MPYIRLETSAQMPQDIVAEIQRALSQTLSEVLGKPEQYVMVSLNQQPMLLSGTDKPAAFLDIRSIGGLNGDINRKLSKSLCAVVEDKIGVAQNRVYLNFSDISSGNWGCDGGTFG